MQGATYSTLNTLIHIYIYIYIVFIYIYIYIFILVVCGFPVSPFVMMARWLARSPKQHAKRHAVLVDAQAALAAAGGTPRDAGVAKDLPPQLECLARSIALAATCPQVPWRTVLAVPAARRSLTTTLLQAVDTKEKLLSHVLDDVRFIQALGTTL